MKKRSLFILAVLTALVSCEERLPVRNEPEFIQGEFQVRNNHRPIRIDFNPLRGLIVDENIQARIRGNILMAYSNKFGHLVLSTGNKSELAVGYCTLYGDLSGGLGVLSDVPKTMVYHIAKKVNKKGDRIPIAILQREPSAELRKNQKDSDTLPQFSDRCRDG